MWLPEETLAIVKDYVVSIKGPLTTPVGGGIRSLNVALRQELDLYVCLRPVRYFKGVPLAGQGAREDRHGDLPRELGGHLRRHRVGGRIAQAQEGHRFPDQGNGRQEDPLSRDVGIGIKPVSREGTERLMRKAIQYAIDNDRQSVTLVHKGNIMKFTEGGFRDWGYALAQREFGAKPLDGGPWMTFKNPKTGRDIVVKDVIADAFLQQILLRPAEYDVIATLNLNGDYISDALAAQVGGIGIAPGANLSDSVAMFEATHGTAPKYAGKDYVNPGSEILSAEMMLVHMGWKEAAKLIIVEPREGDRRQGRHLRLRAPDAGREAGVVLRLRPGDDRADVGDRPPLRFVQRPAVVGVRADCVADRRSVAPGRSRQKKARLSAGLVAIPARRPRRSVRRPGCWRPACPSGPASRRS